MLNLDTYPKKFMKNYLIFHFLKSRFLTKNLCIFDISINPLLGINEI